MILFFSIVFFLQIKVISFYNGISEFLRSDYIYISSDYIFILLVLSLTLLLAYWGKLILGLLYRI